MNIQSITDTHGNEIHFSVTAQSDPDDNIIITGATITDTIGRVVTVSPSGVSYGGHSVNYTVQYVENSEGVFEPLLVRVTDCLGRMTDYAYQYGEVTGYENRYLLTKVTYPTEGHTDYTYGKKEVRFCKDNPEDYIPKGYITNHWNETVEWSKEHEILYQEFGGRSKWEHWIVDERKSIPSSKNNGYYFVSPVCTGFKRPVRV